MNNKWEDFALIAFHAMKGVLPFWKMQTVINNVR